MRQLMIILLFDALVCGVVVGSLPVEDSEPVVKKAVGKEDRSCYEQTLGGERP